MNVRLVLATLGIVVATAIGNTPATAQQDSALRQEIERRFDVLPLHDGLALRPKSDARGFRSIELTDGTIAIDGVPVTGAELRDKVGSDADAIIRLSYLESNARRSLLGLPAAGDRRPPEVTASPASPPEVARSPSAPTRTRRSESQVRFGGSVTVGEDEIIEGDVVAIGGSVRVDGQVTGDVVAIGGAVELGPHADIAKDVAVIGGSVRRAEGARIGGRLSEIGSGRVGLNGMRFRRVPFRMWSNGWTLAPFFALTLTFARFIVLSVLVSLVMLIAHEHVARVGARAAAEPLKAGLVGVLAQLLFVPLLIMTIVMLVITLIGIPLLALIPFVVLAAAIISLVGFSAVAYGLGQAVAARFGWSGQNPYATAILGIIVVLSPIILGRMIGLAGGLMFPLTIALIALGLLFEYLAWTIGLGAVALLRFEKTAQP